MTTNIGRKIRADAKLERLDEAQREQLHFWFAENFTYYEVVKRLQQDFGISVGKSTVAAYWKRHILPEQRQDDMETVATFRALPAGDFSAAILQRVWALAWEALAQSHPNIDKAAKLLAIAQKAEQHALAVKRLALQERRVALREKLAARQLDSTPAKKRSAVPSEPRPAEPAPGEVHEATPELDEPNSLRFPGYAGQIRTEIEVQADRAQPKATSGSMEETERGEDTDAATKAQSCEGRSKGPENTDVSAMAIESAPRVPRPTLAPSTQQVLSDPGKTAFSGL